MGGRRSGARGRSSCWLLPALLGAVMTARAGLAADAEAPGAPAERDQSQQPVRQYVDAKGRLCRVYARQIVIDGATQTAYATLCRDPDGRWVIAR
jgi:hypothetical protein